MGRKPNALVSEYFTRGAKCSDTSNRYSHSCKRCGQHFPKGRVDSLMSHLLRRCSHTSQVERNLIYKAIQQQNPAAPTQGRATSRSPGAVFDDVAATQSQMQLRPPTSQHAQEQSALDTLAEVSRQRLDVSSQDQASGHSDVEQTAPGVEQPTEDEQFYAQLQEAVKAAPDRPDGEDTSQSEGQSDTIDPIRANDAPPPLVETASAANKHFEQSLRQENLDPALGNHDAPMREDSNSYRPPEGDDLQATSTEDGSDGPDSAFTHERPDSSNREPGFSASNSMLVVEDHGPMSWVSTNGPTEAHPSSHSLRNIMAAAKKPISFLLNDGLPTTHTFSSSLADVMAASNQPISGFGPLRNNTKVRSKFTDNRRKEVQEIRKRGACIRCRMLKKPCSEGTPCNTCKTVGSARLWKGACLRTRLADEFTLWSVGHFVSKAQTVVAGAAQGLEVTSTEAVLEVCLFSGGDSYIALPARRYNQNNLAKQRTAMNAYSGEDPELVLRAHMEAHMDSPPMYLLGDEAEILSKLEESINQLAEACVGKEPSPFLKVTLQRAQVMIRDEENETQRTPANGTVRASYTFQNQLLRNVVELWISTTIVTRRNEGDIHFRLPTQEDTPVELLPQNLPILQTQLLAYLESRCATLSKPILNELERRLLQRQQVSRFGTFLSSVILLNCVERMTGFFYSMEQTEKDDDDSTTPALSSQGSHFADLLIMLLRMRGLPPRTRGDSQGRMVVVRPAAAPIVSSSSAAAAVAPISESKKQEYEALEVAGEWLDPLGLDFEEVKRLREERKDGGEGGRGWDMRFISRALVAGD